MLIFLNIIKKGTKIQMINNYTHQKPSVTVETKGKRRMKSLLTTPLVILALLAPLYAGADSDRGVAASQAGDYETLEKILKKAAEQGNASAQFNLGNMYRLGEAVIQDDEEAVTWFRLASEQGHASAQFNLGLMYRDGKGVLKDDKEAVKWYQLAAAQGTAGAQYNLGYMYRYGNGVLQDDKEAVKWYQLAAEQGIVEAQFNIGVMYANGEGVLEDDVYAWMWWDIATSKGHEKGKGYRDSLSKVMTPSQIAEAQKLARECVAKDYKDC